MRRLVLALTLVLLLPRPGAAQETIEYYATDTIGSIRIVFNVSGTAVARQDYAPFGRPLFTVPAMPKEGFGGQEKDDEADEAYFHARMFQARLGRFAQPDPIGAGLFSPQRWNRYAYALNSPLVFTDSTGLVADCVDSDTNSCVVGDDPRQWELDYCFEQPSRCWGWANGGGGGWGGSTGWSDGGEGGGSGGAPQNPINPDKPVVVLPNGTEIDPNNCTIDNGCVKLGMALPAGGLGAAGEKIVKVIVGAAALGSKGKFLVDGRNRIADGYLPKLITEIKNVAYQAYTLQLRDYVAHAAEHPGMEFDLWVRTTTQLSGPLQAAVRAGVINIRFFPWP